MTTIDISLLHDAIETQAAEATAELLIYEACLTHLQPGDMTDYQTLISTVPGHTGPQVIVTMINLSNKNTRLNGPLGNLTTISRQFCHEYLTNGNTHTAAVLAHFLSAIDWPKIDERRQREPHTRTLQRVDEFWAELIKLRDYIWMSGDPFAPSFAGWCFHCGTAQEEPHNPDCAWLAEARGREAGA